MIYKRDEGIKKDPAEKARAGLIVGLPVAALILISAGVLSAHPANQSSGHTSAANPHVIPVVSTNAASRSNNPKQSSGSTGQPATATAPPQVAASGSNGGYGGTSPSGSYPYGGSGSSASQPVTGGRGGVGDTSGTQSGGLPLNYTIGVPPVSVGDGSKPVLSTSGSTLTVN